MLIRTRPDVMLKRHVLILTSSLCRHSARGHLFCLHGFYVNRVFIYSDRRDVDKVPTKGFILELATVKWKTKCVHVH